MEKARLGNHCIGDRGDSSLVRDDRGGRCQYWYGRGSKGCIALADQGYCITVNMQVHRQIYKRHEGDNVPV